MRIDEINQQIVIKFLVWKWIKDIRALSKEITDFFVTNGDKSFRGNQVYEWLWVKERTVLRI
jgi:hypothetical protein